MAATNAIKTAIKDDLEDINGSGIFTTLVVEVLTEPKRFDDISSPAVYIISGEGEEEEFALGSGTQRICSQDYVLQCYIHSSTPNADMDDLLDDIRNAFGRSTSNILGINESDYAVIDIKVVWDQLFTEPGLNEGTVLAEATVSVKYEFNAGSL